MNTENQFENIEFILPKNQSNVIKVIGIGGGGSNAINYMFSKGIKGVDYVICNTDSQALENSPVPNKVQLGIKETEGLGAGADPVIGEKAAVESLNEMRRLLEKNTKMVFITAGMGGGTGTGAAPIISKLAMEMDILTVGIVTMPFVFEGKIRLNHANKGLEKLRNNVDSLIVVNNNKLRDVYGNLGVKEGFSKADEVLATAAKGIAEVITHHYTQNIDLKDAKTVLSKSGNAIMGSYTSSGDKRALNAVSNALDSPLLNDNRIDGAQNVLLLIVSGSSEVTIDESGNYVWKSKTKFTKKKGKRLFTTSLSPPSFTFDNYREVLFKEGIGRAFVNTLAVALPSTLIPLIICSFFAYALTWMKFFGRDTLLALIIASLVVPLQMSLIPILTIYNDFGALFGVAAKSYPGVWMAHTGFGLASTTFLLRNFLKSLPNEMMEAAKVDGASHYDIFLKIILPLSIPAFASIFILQFLWCWNDLLVGLVFLDQVPSEIILTAKLKELLGSRGENWEILTTGAFVSMTVPLFIFFALQRYFIRGLVAGSVKG